MADKELIKATKRAFSALIESAFGVRKNKIQSGQTSEPRYSNSFVFYLFNLFFRFSYHFLG